MLNNSPKDQASYINRGFGKLAKTTKKSSLSDYVYFFKNSIIMDDMDKDLYKIALTQSKKLKETPPRLKKEGFPNYSHLQEDAFASLFKAKPVLRDARVMDHQYLINQMVMEAAMQTSGYRELRSMTIGDDIASIIGTESFIDVIEKLLKNKKDQLNQEQQAAEQAQQQLQELLEQLGKGGSGDTTSDQTKIAGGLKPANSGDDPANQINNILKDPTPTLTLEQAMERAEKARKQLQNKVNNVIVPQLTEALKQTNQELKRHSELIQQWGLDSSAAALKMSAQERLALIQKIKNSKKLQEIAKLLGKFKPIATTLERQRVKTIPMRLQKITYGDSIGRVIPADVALYANKKTRPLFFAKFTEKRLRQLDYDGHTTLGKGPIVLCLDESGSMSGKSEEWGKAVGLTVLDMAQSQNRDFVFIHFDCRSADELRCDMYLKNDAPDPLKVIDTAEHFYGGGTSFEEPLNKAREIIDNQPEFSKADIIFITDGECAVGPTWLEDFNKWRESKKIRLLSILIDSGYHSSSMLNVMSDSVTLLTDIQNNGEKIATQIFENLV